MHQTRMMAPSSMKKAPGSAAVTPQTPYGEREESSSSSIHLTVSSPELDTSQPQDAYMEQMSEAMEEDSPEAQSVHEALADISIIDVPTPVSSPPQSSRAGAGRGRARRRINLEGAGVAEPGIMRIPSRTSAPPLFDVYTDTPSTVRNTSRTGPPLLVSRPPSGIASQARQFLMYMRNVGRKGQSTDMSISKDPIVDDSQLPHGGRCRITFRSDEEVEEPRPLGVISIPHAVLPSKPATRAGGRGMLVVDPVYVVPPSRAITLVLPGTQPNLLVDHFVLHLSNGPVYPVVGIAIAKQVLASLLHVHETELKFYDVPVDDGITISLVLRVYRIRNDTAKRRLLVAIDRVDWYVPNGIEEMTRFDPQRGARAQRFNVYESPPQTPMMDTGFVRSPERSEEEGDVESGWSDGDDAEIERQYLASAVSIKGAPASLHE